MKKHCKSIAILFAFILILSFFLYTNIVNNKKINKLNILTTNIVTQNELLKNSLFQNSVFNGSDINKKFTTKDNNEIFLSDIIKDSTLIIRIFENTCAPCMNKELSNISKLEKKGIPILILSTFTNTRALASLLNQFNINSKTYNLKHDEHLFTFDGNSDIYVFLLTKDLKVRYLFFPVQNDKDVSSSYYQHIENIFRKVDVSKY